MRLAHACYAVHPPVFPPPPAFGRHALLFAYHTLPSNRYRFPSSDIDHCASGENSLHPSSALPFSPSCSSCMRSIANDSPNQARPRVAARIAQVDDQGEVSTTSNPLVSVPSLSTSFIDVGGRQGRTSAQRRDQRRGYGRCAPVGRVSTLLGGGYCAGRY